MKETVSANIGSMAFTLDDDAYAALRSYFNDIRSRLPESDTETMGDIEARMAELLRERVSSPMRVISLEVVHAAIAQMGEPSCFGDPREEAGDEAEARPEPPRRRLCRPLTNRSIAGVCGGIAEFFDADVTMIRLVTLLLILFGGISIWIYVILWIVIPEEPIRPISLGNKASKQYK